MSLSSGGRIGRSLRRLRRSWRLLMRSLVLSSVLTAAICGLLLIALLWTSGRAATNRAIDGARQRGEIDSRVVFAPYVTDAVLAGEPAALAELTAVGRRYLQVSGGIRVKVWEPEGRIVYSDEPGLIGQVFDFEDVELDQLLRGETVATLTDLGKAENMLERSQGRLLEVYVPSATESGRTVFIETYYPDRLIEDAVRILRSRSAPVVTSAVGVLAGVLFPAVTLLVLRLARNRRQRALLMERLLDVSDSERRRVAGEVHDGAVQDLIGLTMALGGVAERAPAADSARLQALSTELSGVVVRLRDLLTSIYPASRSNGRPYVALVAMAQMLQSRGIEVAIHVEPELQLEPDEEAVVLRTVQELTRNIASHSQATEATIAVRATRTTVVATVHDNGVGFDPTVVATERPGHFGLRLLSDLADQSGGTFVMTTEPGKGTRAHLELDRP